MRFILKCSSRFALWLLLCGSLVIPSLSAAQIAAWTPRELQLMQETLGLYGAGTIYVPPMPPITLFVPQPLLATPGIVGTPGIYSMIWVAPWGFGGPRYPGVTWGTPLILGE
jgi:hypothetical protein